MIKSPAKPVEPIFLGGILLAALSSLSLGCTMRTKLLKEALGAWHSHADDAAAWIRWRSANLLSFTFAETITLFGVALKALGAPWVQAGAFFVVGLMVLLLWRPRLALPSSAGVTSAV